MSGTLQADRAQAERAGERLREIASPARLQILSLLLAGELAVAEIEDRLDIRQPGLSQHLSALRKTGLITSRRAAKSVFYRLSDVRSETFVAGLDRLLGGGELQPPPAAKPIPPPVERARRPSGAAVFAETPHRFVLPPLRRAAPGSQG